MNEPTAVELAQTQAKPIPAEWLRADRRAVEAADRARVEKPKRRAKNRAARAARRANRR